MNVPSFNVSSFYRSSFLNLKQIPLGFSCCCYYSESEFPFKSLFTSDDECETEIKVMLEHFNEPHLEIK
jgi:hypothetical protein